MHVCSTCHMCSVTCTSCDLIEKCGIGTACIRSYWCVDWTRQSFNAMQHITVFSTLCKNFSHFCKHFQKISRVHWFSIFLGLCGRVRRSSIIFRLFNAFWRISQIFDFFRLAFIPKLVFLDFSSTSNTCCQCSHFGKHFRKISKFAFDFRYSLDFSTEFGDFR